MDLTNTFETNDAVQTHDASHRNEGSQSTASELKDSLEHSKQTEKATVNPHLGRDIAIAMACMDAADRLKKIKANTSEKFQNTDNKSDSHNHSDFDTDPPSLSASELNSKLRKISAEIDTHRAELIGLLVLFDDRKGWEANGARHCADWANSHLGIAKSSVYEFLRVGRELQKLPVIRGLFRGGELSWSKTKILTRVADKNNERDLANVALEATVSDVERFCREFRWPRSDAATIDPETGRTLADLQAEQQFNNRSFTWRDQSDGSVQIRLTLPPEKAQAVLKSMEHCVNELYEPYDTGDDVDTDVDADLTTKPTVSQKRADAIVLMAERSLAHAGTDVSRSDRYQVILHVETADFMGSSLSTSHSPTENDNPLPSKLPWIEGVGPIADSVARRIASDASIVSLLTQDGEPLNIGRKSRIWPAGIRRAIMSRDRHCQFPGCSQHRYLDIHHIEHWVDGGETSVDNGVCLCQRHHTLVHEGGYTVERNTVETNVQSDSKNFGVTTGFVSRAKKALLQTRCRFRFIKPSSGDKSSACFDNQYNDNQCNEAPVDYWVTRISNDASDAIGGDVSTWRLNEEERVYH